MVNSKSEVLTRNSAAGKGPPLDSNRRSRLNPAILNISPKFEGHKHDNSYDHLAEFDNVCTALHDPDANLDKVKLTLFSHTLGEDAKNWMKYLRGGPYDKFDELAELFLQRYYPESLTAKLRADIIRIKQKGDENLQEYYERFVRLCASCPNHNLDEVSLMAQFVSGMDNHEHRFLECSAGGNFNHLTIKHVRDLIVKNAKSMIVITAKAIPRAQKNYE